MSREETILKGLDEEQRRAVTFDLRRPLKVVAGAGSGKTTVIVRRFAWIAHKDRSIEPGNIMCVTFTNKAAEEMRQRIVNLLGECGFGLDPMEEVRLPIGTFHSLFGRLLREHGVSIGVPPDFTVLSEAQQLAVFFEAFDEHACSRAEDYGELVINDPQAFAVSAFSFILRLKDFLIDPDRFGEVARAGGAEFRREASALLGKATERDRLEREMGIERQFIHLLQALYSAYEERLRRDNLIDFAGIMLKSYVLLMKNPRLLNSLKKQYSYILVDEFQDTNGGQFEILKLLAADDIMGNITVVGDDKQAIYEWRDARIENMADFDAKGWGGETIYLKCNYRSYGGILEVAHHSITREPPFDSRADAIRLRARRTSDENGLAVRLFHCESRQEEARFVSSTIARLLSEEKLVWDKVSGDFRAIRPADIAILMRSVRPSAVYEDELRSLCIPYKTVGGIGFYDRREIRDILSYLTLIQNPRDDVALFRALKSPPFGLSDHAIDLVRSKSSCPSFFDSVELFLEGSGPAESSVADRLRRFIDFYSNVVSSTTFTLADLIRLVVDESGYLEHILSLPPGGRYRSIRNYEMLLDLARRHERVFPHATIASFICYVDIAFDYDVAQGEAGMEDDRDAVQIMSIHQAKGLEYPVVFLINAKGKSFPLAPRFPPFHLDPDYGLVVKRMDGRKSLKFSPPKALSGLPNPEESSRLRHYREERRICYVALTRSRDCLYFSCPEQMGGTAKNFYREILEGFAGREKVRLVERIPEARPLEMAGRPEDTARAGKDLFMDCGKAIRRATVSAPIKEMKSVRMSFSDISLFERCPLRYRYRRLLRIDDPHHIYRGADVDARYSPSLMGLAVHNAIRDDSPAARDRLGHMMDVFKGVCMSELASEEVYLRIYAEEGRRMIENYLGSDLASIPANFVEEEFSWRVDSGGPDFFIQGRIDRIHRNPDGSWEIVDYKTNRSLLEESLAPYQFQLKLYATAFKELYLPSLPHGDVRMSIYHLTENRLISVRMEMGDEERIRERVREIAGKVAAKDFRLTEAHRNRNCYACEYGGPRGFCSFSQPPSQIFAAEEDLRRIEVADEELPPWLTRGGIAEILQRSEKFSNVRYLCRGGMAYIYRARDEFLEEDVVLKVISPSELLKNPQATDDFLFEARATVKLRHDNIVSVFDVNVVDGIYYLELAFVRGGSLRETMAERAPLPIADIKGVLKGLCSALAYAHDSGVIHRDVKPSNILISDEGRVLLCDFGIVKIARGGEATASSAPFGSLNYMAPEQCEEAFSVGPAADIYSAGVLIYEMATGRLPLPPGPVGPCYPRKLDEIIARCLERNPVNRYPSAAALWREISAL